MGPLGIGIFVNVIKVLELTRSTAHDTTDVMQDTATTRTNSKMLPQTNIRPDKFDFLLYQDGK